MLLSRHVLQIIAKLTVQQCVTWIRDISCISFTGSWYSCIVFMIIPFYKIVAVVKDLPAAVVQMMSSDEC